MLYAGLRRGELIPLLWRDVDLSAGTISVNKSVEFINGVPNLKSGGKTKAAARTVYIPQLLVDYLKPLAGNPFALVCPSAKGKLMSDSAWKRLWNSYIAELNFKYGDFGKSIEWNKGKDGSPLKRKAPKSRFTPEKIPIIIPKFTAHSLRHQYVKYTTKKYCVFSELFLRSDNRSSVRKSSEGYTQFPPCYSGTHTPVLSAVRQESV